MMNQPTDSRRFVRTETKEIYAIFDTRPGYRIYAPVTYIDGAIALDLSAARSFFDDEMEEIH